MFGFLSVISSVKEINSSLETPQAEIWSTFSAKYGYKTKVNPLLIYGCVFKMLIAV